MDRRRKETIIVAGGNGVGKTTFAREFLLENPDYGFLNADEIAKELSPDSPQNSKISAGKTFFKKLGEYVDNEKSFLIESTLSGRYLIKFIKELKEYGYRVRIVFIFVDSADILIGRIQNRVIKGGHFVADEDVRRRFKRGKNNLMTVYKGFSYFWGLVYNSEAGFINVADGKADDVTAFNKELYEKFLSI
jgi:predicted ABC-type ATPase